MFQRLTNEEFLENLKKYNVKYIPLELYKKAHTKMKFQCDKNPNHIFEASPSDVYCGKTHCPYCMRTKVSVGETDMWTERPDIAKMLLHPEDGYKYFATSGTKVDWVCPNCGSIVNKIINNVVMQGLSCSNCGDGMSFGEKLINELLQQLNIDFLFNKAMSWSQNRRYDFIILSLDTIIEVHGLQHFRSSFSFANFGRKARNVEEEQENDLFKKELALNNGILHYVELDCRFSDFDYIKQSVLDSELSRIFDLSVIDWNKCFEATGISNVAKCADLWNQGMKNTKEIADKICMDRTSVIEYLKKAKTLGLCDYDTHYDKMISLSNVVKIWNEQTKNIKEISSILELSYSYVDQLLLLAQKENLCDYKRSYPHKHRRHKRKIICVETQKVYNSISSVELDGYDRRGVNNCLGGWAKSAYGKHWKYID